MQSYLQAHARENEQLDELQEQIGSTTLSLVEDLVDEPDIRERLIIEMDNIVATATAAAESGDSTLPAEIAALVSDNDEPLREAGYAYELALLEALGDGRALEFEQVEDSPEAAPDEDAEEIIPAAVNEDAQEEAVAAEDDLDVEEEETETAPPLDTVCRRRDLHARR